MADDPIIRSLFHDGEEHAHSIDVDEVVRRSRRRRLPARIAVVGGSTLAVVGLFVGGGWAITHSTVSSATSALDSGAQPDAAPAPVATGQGDTAGGVTQSEIEVGSGPLAASAGGGSGVIKRAPIEKVNLCGGTLADISPTTSGLALSVDFPASVAAGAASVEGTVTLTNEGTGTVTGYTSPHPVVTLSHDGVTTWHSNGATDMIAAEVDLAPGASMSFAASFEPLECGTPDELEDGFRADLPRAPAGDYAVSAIMLVTSASSEGELVSSPTEPITLR